MDKVEPGNYIPLETVEKILTEHAYGVLDLVDLKLFHTESRARDAIQSGKLKSQKVNKRSVIICRNDILEYWKKHRSKPFEAPNKQFNIRLTHSDVEFIHSLVEFGQKQFNTKFCVSDLFRNLFKLVKKIHATGEVDYLFAIN